MSRDRQLLLAAMSIFCSLMLLSLSGCGKDRPADAPPWPAPYECRPCPPGLICPQECYAP